MADIVEIKKVNNGFIIECDENRHSTSSRKKTYVAKDKMDLMLTLWREVFNDGKKMKGNLKDMVTLTEESEFIDKLNEINEDEDEDEIKPKKRKGILEKLEEEEEDEESEDDDY